LQHDVAKKSSFIDLYWNVAAFDNLWHIKPRITRSKSANVRAKEERAE